MTNLPAKVSPELMVGLEDFDASDMQMPRQKIDHETGEMVDSLSGERNSSLTVILLALIKGRTCWDAEVSGDKVGPLCRSVNFIQGSPDPKRFPWKASGFKLADYSEPGSVLPCDGCQLKEWGTHPKNETPWCSTQFTLAMLQPMAGGGWAPTLLTLQRSGIKATQAYMTSFVRQGLTLFTSETTITLQQLRRGTVKYSVPQFVKGEATNADEWQEFAEQARRIRAFVQTPRDEGPATEEATATTARSAAATDDDEAIDF